MIRTIFKNLKRHKRVKESIQDRIESVCDRFPDLKDSRLTVTVSMDNSPFQKGLDQFSVKFFSQGGRYKNIVLEKSAPQLHLALSELVDRLLERLNRYGDKRRVLKIRAQRGVQEMAHESL